MSKSPVSIGASKSVAKKASLGPMTPCNFSKGDQVYNPDICPVAFRIDHDMIDWFTGKEMKEVVVTGQPSDGSCRFYIKSNPIMQG